MTDRHPASGKATAEARFKEVGEAYSVLNDRELLPPIECQRC